MRTFRVMPLSQSSAYVRTAREHHLSVTVAAAKRKQTERSVTQREFVARACRDLGIGGDCGGQKAEEA